MLNEHTIRQSFSWLHCAAGAVGTGEPWPVELEIRIVTLFWPFLVVKKHLFLKAYEPLVIIYGPPYEWPREAEQ